MRRPAPTSSNSNPVPPNGIEIASPAGFPIPHTDSANTTIDLNAQLLVNPCSSYLFRVKGDSMAGIGIFEGDAIVVDRSVEPQHNHIVLAVVDGEYMVRRLYKRARTIRLVPENGKYRLLEMAEGHELVIWGVVTASIRKLV